MKTPHCLVGPKGVFVGFGILHLGPVFFFFFSLNEEENWRGREFALQIGTVDDGFPSTFTSTLLFLFTYFLFLNQTESKVSEKKSNELSKFEHRFGEF